MNAPRIEEVTLALGSGRVRIGELPDGSSQITIIGSEPDETGVLTVKNPQLLHGIFLAIEAYLAHGARP